MNWVARIVLCLYGLIVIVGGYMGYESSGSTASLAWGAGSGVLALGAFFLSFKRPRTGLFLGAVIAAVVAVRMGMRFVDALKDEGTFMSKFMPGGMVATLSVLVAVLCLSGAFARGKSKKST